MLYPIWQICIIKDLFMMIEGKILSLTIFLLQFEGE